jgi:hypothetical protein
VRPAPGPAFAAGLRFAARPKVVVEAEVGWAPTQLRVSENAGTRDVQSMSQVGALLGASWQLRDGLEMGGAAGVVTYLTDDRGLFAEGSSVAPVLRGHLGLRMPWWQQRLSLRAAAQIQRFGTPAIRRIGGTDGVVTRIDIGARVRLVELGR